MLLACVATPAIAAADDAHDQAHDPARDAAQAQSFFDEAKALMNQGSFAEACTKFEASQRLDPAAGTLLNLANCYAKSGRTATAWSTFKAAASAARVSNRKDWEKVATDRIAELEPQLARLTVNVAVADPARVIRLDGATMSPNAFGVATPIDPGAHTVDAEETGKKPFHLALTVPERGSAGITIPPADDLPPAAPVAPPSAPVSEDSSPPARGSVQRTIGIVVGSAGVVGLGVGVVTGLLALGKAHDAKSICPNSGYCANPAAAADNSSARSTGTVSTLGFIAGAALLGGGAALFFTAPHDSASSTTTALRAAPLVGRGEAGLLLGGGF